MGAPLYFTNIQGVGITGLAQSVTHSLGIAPGSLNCVVMQHQVVMTSTCGVQYQTMATNSVTVSTNGLSTLTTVDVIVWQQHSLVS